MIFEPVNLGKWKDREYIVPADDVLKCIAKVEAVVSLMELGAMRLSGNLQIAKLAQGLAAALRHAGATVTDEELYNEIFKERGRALAARAWATLSALEMLMVPPEHLRAPAGKAERGGRAASSRKRTSS